MLIHARFDVVAPTKEQRQAFDSGHPTLDRWLARQARQSLESRDAVTYLLVDEETDPPTIAGYYCLSAGEVSKAVAPENLARRAPEPIPAVRMGRFAIDRRYQGRGLGRDLLREALLGAVSAGRVIGARVLLVDAIDDAAMAFYRRYGFEESPIHPRQLFHVLHVIAASAGIDD